MRKLFRKIQTPLLYITALLLVVGYPLGVMAETPEATTSEPVTTTSEQQPVVPPEPAETFSFNKSTGRWDSNKWQYNGATGRYEAVPPPAPVVIDPAATSTQPADKGDSSTATTDVTTDVTLDNKLTSDAQSGDSTVSKNTLGGNATTGDAAATATLINNVNSVLAAGGNEKVAEFTQDVMGDVKGDIMLYPMLLKTMMEAGTVDTSQTINAQQNNTINNDLTLNATSGDATVGYNTTGGNATTGSADTVANVMNILNSMISAQRSFVGTINIYGNLEGDILIAPDFIPQMIANNKELQVGSISQTDIETQDRQTIINNIALAAESGKAAVTGNTTGGDATTGSADTNIVIFNLSGHEIIASNSLLVFVNVLGKWVGVIVDAPTGATSAMIGNNVSKNVAVEPDLTINANTTNTITNNLTLNSRSGDATVIGNTTGGNATTGNATASANVANISGTKLGVSDWFGILFINVFGSWMGSFGVNTAYGDTPTVQQSSGGAGGKPGVIEFVPRAAAAAATVQRVTLIDSEQLALANQDETNDQAALAATSAEGGARPAAQQAPSSNLLSSVEVDYRLPIAAGSMFIIGASALGLRRLLRATDEAEVAPLK